MNNRDTILAAVKDAVQVASGVKQHAMETDESLFRQIDASCNAHPDDAVTWFKKEVEKVSGEVFTVHDAEEAVSVIQKIIISEKYQRIAVTPEPVCMEIVDRLKTADASIDVFHALSVKGPERKKCLENIPISLVYAPYAICDTGTLVFPCDDSGTSLPHFLSECVVAVVSSASLVQTQFHLFRAIAPEKTENMFFVTGPSRTADIEKVLILGAHGPKRLVVLLLSATG